MILAERAYRFIHTRKEDGMKPAGKIIRVVVTQSLYRDGWTAVGMDSEGRNVIYCQRKTEGDAAAAADMLRKNL